jgi:hypothetical protein
MTLRLATSLLASCFVLVVLQLLMFFVGPVTGILGGALVALVSVLLLRFFHADLSAKWLSVLLPIGSSLAATVIVFFGGVDRKPEVALASLVTAACCMAIIEVAHLRSKKCGLCGRRLAGEVSFRCPRCPLVVCDRCWLFGFFRCRLCEENRVPIFPSDSRWWDRQFGVRLAYGRCQLCMTPAEEVDLRACRSCGRPQCRDCWDASNGQCSRCHWIVNDLPQALRMYIRAAPPQGV